MLQGEPDTAAEDRIAAQLGLRIERPPAEPTPVWLDHWEGTRVVEAMTTQWRTFPNGTLSGLRYEAVPGVMAMLDVPEDERAQAFACMRSIEATMITRSRAAAEARDLPPGVPAA